MLVRWQAVHCMPLRWARYPGETCAYAIVGVQAVVRWQASQDLVVAKWLPDLPVAVLPLWQVLQLPGVIAVWLNVAGVHAVVRWHWSQLAVVGRWLAFLPAAVVPLWQVVQLPGVTALWLKVAGVHAVVRWH